MRKADKQERDKLLEKQDRMTGRALALNENSQTQIKVIEELKQMLLERDTLIEKLQKENVTLKEQKKPNRKNLYSSKSKKTSAPHTIHYSQFAR